MTQPSPFSRADLERRGFRGFFSLEALRRLGLTVIPNKPGCYAVLYESVEPPVFLERSPAGHFRGRDPTISVDELRTAWHADCETIYLGQSSDLRSRWATRLKFGAGQPIGAWGGRAMWQIANPGSLLLAWKVCEDDESPRTVETDLLREFHSACGGRPFANRR